MCVRGSLQLRVFLDDNDIQDGNFGGNRYLYYYYTNGKLGVSDHKPSRHREVSLKAFTKALGLCEKQ